MASIFKNYGLDDINDFQSLRCDKTLDKSFIRDGDVSVEVLPANANEKNNIDYTSKCLFNNRVSTKDTTNNLLKKN